MKFGSYLTAIFKKNRRVFSIILLVILGLVLSSGISMFSGEHSVGIEATRTQASSRETCLNLSKNYKPTTLSFLNRSVYDRTRNPICFQRALEAAKEALKNNQVIGDKSTKQIDWLETQLNQLSLLIDVTQWLKDKEKKLIYDQWMPKQIKIDQRVKDNLQEWEGLLQNQIAILPKIQTSLQSETQSSTASLIYAQVNFAWNLNRLKEFFPNFDGNSWDQTGETLLKTAIKNAQKLSDKQPEIYALGYYGKWYQTRKQYDNAQKQTENALRLAESIQAKNIYQWQWQLGQIHQAQYENYKDKKALEKVKLAYESALTAYENAYNSLQALRYDLLASTEDQQWTFREKVEEQVYREYVDLILQRTDFSDQNFPLTLEELTKVRKVLDSLQIAELESFLQEPCPGFSSELLDQIVEKQDSTAAVIYPIFTDNRIAVIIKLSGDKNLYYKIDLITRIKNAKKETRKSEIESIFRKLRYSLEQPYFSSKIGIITSQQVYDWLIRPAEDAKIITPEKIKTLLFVPDGLLRNIPMAALYDSKSKKFLIEKYAVGIAPSLQTSAAKPSNDYKALIAGLSQDPRLPDFGSLKYAKEEVCEVREILENSLTILNGEEIDGAKKDICQSSQKSKLLSKELALSQYNIIHLATHGQFSFFNRNDTFVLTSFNKDQDKDQDKDKKIDLNEWEKLVKDRGFNSIELLTLSACETATGDDRDTLGISGVSVRAGARSTLASLWTVDDSSTAKFMKEFYKALVQEKLSKAEALQKAQISLLGDGYQPSHWSPFVLVGDWR